MTIDTSVGDFIGEVIKERHDEIGAALVKLIEQWKLEDPRFGDFNLDRLLDESPEEYAKVCGIIRDALFGGRCADLTPAREPTAAHVSAAASAIWDRLYAETLDVVGISSEQKRQQLERCGEAFILAARAARLVDLRP